MPWTNYHGHCYYCDGKFAPEAYVEKAIELAMPAIGFSSHCPFKGGHAWNMKIEDLSNYFQEVSLLKEKYADDIEIYLGLEMDYIPDVIDDAQPFIREAHLDYLIGSIHYTGVFDDGRFCEIDGSHTKFLEGLNGIYNHNIQTMITHHFELMRCMIQQETTAVLGHLDKIKIQAEQGVLFSEFENWYRKEVEKTLQVIQDTDTILEVNTRGIYKKKTVDTYPSKWILELAYEMNIPIMLNADAHHPDELNAMFEVTAKQLKGIGFKELSVLKRGEWVALPFSPKGVEWN